MSYVTHPYRIKAAITCAAIASTLLLTTAVTSAGQPAVDLTESGTARKYAELTVIARPADLTISSEDVSRGYVDVPLVARISVRSNTESFLLMLQGDAAYASEILVRGLDEELQFGGRGGFLKQVESKVLGVKNATIDLSFRFNLAASAAPGVHPWPIRMAASPL
jgi:hypothetical protein